MYLFGFFLGILVHVTWYPLPFFVIGLLFKPWQFLVSFLFGLLWMTLHGAVLPIQDEYPVLYDGKIIGFYSNHRWLVQIEHRNHQSEKGQVYLQCYQNCPKAYPGERWSWFGKIVSKNSYANPGKTDFWMRPDFRHIRGSGYFLSHTFQKQKTISHYDFLNRLKVYLYQQSSKKMNTDNHFARKIFLALVLGIGSELDNQDWDMFKLTGTAHLMVVSGAHLSLLMGLLDWIVSFLWTRSKYLCQWLPVKKVSTGLSLLIGLFYAGITGWGIPIQRALIMHFFYGLRYFIPLRINAWQSLQYSFWLILLLEPHSIFYPGTYLSYVAVMLLMATPLISSYKGLIGHIVQQVVCVIGMAPFTLFWFSNLPILGILANMIAIPWVSWLLLPTAMLSGLTIMTENTWILKAYFYLTNLLQQFLQWILKGQFLNIQWQYPSYWLFMLSILLILLCIIPLRNLRWIVCCLCLLSHTTLKHPPKPYQFQIDVLDIGQGLSVMVRTSNHRLLFDTAGKVGRLSLAEMLIGPYFKHEHTSQIDKVILSHPDEDHIGGVDFIKAAIKVQEWIDDKQCQFIKPWSWDGVRFQFLKYPYPNAKKNNHSCVLSISNHFQRFLITADIERPAEYQLLRRYGGRLKSDVLLIPHHGSLTSSSASFLDKVKPKLAILSVANINRYHLPNIEVLKRYERFHIPVLSTAETGMIRMLFLNHEFKLSTWRNPSWLGWLMD